MALSLTFADALLKEVYAAQLQMQLDLSRQLFWDPNPAYGPPTPGWLAAGKMFNDAPYVDYSNVEDDYGCDCCGY